MGLLARVAPYIGAPYRLHGRSPEGWDCWGCVRHLRRELFGRESPDWSETYSLADGASTARLAQRVEQLVAERLSAWRAVEPRPGAVALLEVFRRRAHVGLMLDEVHMIHALGGCATAVERIDSPIWRRRLAGVYDA